MEISSNLIEELQNRLKVGNRRGVHLNAVPGRSRYKFDLSRLSHIDESLPQDFIDALLTQLPLKFKISWKDNVPDLNSLFEEDQTQLVKITKSLENLINQTNAIESEKGINTFGFGFPIIVRRDQKDNKLTIAPLLIWSLRIKQTKEFNTWNILRSDEDPIYINEVLINHLISDSEIEINQISAEHLEDGLIDSEELIDICSEIISSINTKVDENIKSIFKTKLNSVTPIRDKKHYEKLPITPNNSLIEFGGLFSIFEVQKQNIINDYKNLLDLEGLTIDLKDLKSHHFQPISSVQTDPSQQGILNSLKTSRNILIQGPPGTGKSQSLTAILINALENQKKTIVVCEKQTALDVLHKALIDNGLNYHCTVIKDIVRDRRKVVNSVRERVDNSSYRKYRFSHSKESLQSITDKASKLIKSINKKHKKLDDKIIGDKNWTSVVGDLLAELREGIEDYNVNSFPQFSYNPQELNEWAEITKEGQKHYIEYKAVESQSFINGNKLIGDNPYKIEEQIKNDFKSYQSLLDNINSLHEEAKIEYHDLRSQEIKNEVKIVTEKIDIVLRKEEELPQLLTDVYHNYRDFRTKELTSQINDCEGYILEIQSILSRNKENPDLTNESKIHGAFYKFLSIFSSKKKQTLIDHSKISSLLLELNQFLSTAKDLGDLNSSGSLDQKLKLLQKISKSLVTAKVEFKTKIDKEISDLELHNILDLENNQFSSIDNEIINSDSNNGLILKSIREELSGYLDEINLLTIELLNTIKICKDIYCENNFEKKSFVDKKKILNELKLKIDSMNITHNIQKEIKSINFLKPSNNNTIAAKDIQTKYRFLKEQIQYDNWVQIKFRGDDLSDLTTKTKDLIDKVSDYLNGDGDRFTPEFNWHRFINRLTPTQFDVIAELQLKEDWYKVFLVNYLNSALINEANIDLPKDDSELNALNDSLVDLEKEQLKFIKEYWYSKQIDATREFDINNPNLAVENLYNKRSSKRHRRLSLREIAKLDIDLFTTFFPIILTTPDVASNLFKGKNKYFDIVMFDEASQLKLEDNLPALLKGKQVVIAGDEHQMPPSNYFSKIFEGLIDDEDEFEDERDKIRNDLNNTLLDCESLLEFATQLGFDKMHLDFHYRSRHPYLIDFSNAAFYNQRLKPLPNKFEYVPITYLNTKGTYSDTSNDTEAEAVLSLLDNNISRLPSGEYPTVGVATFNITQRNLILNKINSRRKFSRYKDFNDKISELEENGFFIKNLENIQGDERDVIILSTTYGINKEGKFNQRFGSINHQKGYKLLNVIITRAKYKIYVVTSMPEDVILNYKEYLQSEGSNNRRAALFSYLAYSKAVSEKDNDLRINVLNSLIDNSSKNSNIDILNSDLESPFEEEVFNYLLDYFPEDSLQTQMQYAGFRIDIVYHPKDKTKPRIAIECDGASFHSSREAYLHDKHRQTILESNNFVFHRIWSTNWWRNTKREINKLVEFIKNIEENSKSISELSESPSVAFSENVDMVFKSLPKPQFKSKKVETQKIDVITKNDKKQIRLFEKSIKVNSIVTVKYINLNKELKVKLVERNSAKKSNGIQEININSPLGAALKGKVVGDTVKIGNLDKYVEVLNFEN